MINNDLYNFTVIAEEMNITAAAARLFITQQTLSEQLKKLEKQYGAVLFERRPKLKLTSQGERMLQYARNVLNEEERLMSDLERIGNCSDLRIGYSGTRGAMILASFLPDFAKTYSNLDISLIASPANSLPFMLESGTLDAYIISGGKAPSGCFSEVLYFTKFHYICSKDLLEKYTSKQQLENATYKEKLDLIATIPFSAAPENFPLRKTIEKFFGEHGLKPNITSSATSGSVNLDICRSGTAAIIFPDDMLKKYLGDDENEDLVIFPLPDMKEIEPLTFVCKKGLSKIEIQNTVQMLKKHVPQEHS